jgi:ATP-dependent RNA helicase RhlB
MNNPGEVIIEPEKKTVDSVTQELYHVGKDEKLKLLLGLLKRDNPSNAIIFTNTRHSAWEVAKRLEVNGFHVVPLMGDLPQSKRTRIVEDVKGGKIKFLVATDVAARGLHVDELEMVINYDVPQEPESYIHRIGRTARAGKQGKTITLACEEYVYGLSPIEKLIGGKLPVSWADENLFAEDKSEGMKFAVNDRFKEMKSNKRKKMDPRMSKVQSVVSMAAGGNIEEFSKDGKPSAGSGKKQNNRKSSRRTSSKKPDRDTSGGSRNNKPASSGITEDRIGADSTPEERLAYYRKKYGEDFKFSGSAGSGRPGASSGRGKKNRSGKNAKAAGKKPGTNKSENRKSEFEKDSNKQTGNRQEKTEKKSLIK